jgi:hypothetical protein
MATICLILCKDWLTINLQSYVLGRQYQPSIVSHSKTGFFSIGITNRTKQANDYPVLNYDGIPLNDESMVQKLLRDFMTFQNNNKSFDLFTFPVYNNKPTIAAAQCTTYSLNKRIAKFLNKTPRTENKEALDENQPTITTNAVKDFLPCIVFTSTLANTVLVLYPGRAMDH